MGYCMEQREANFKLKPGKEAAALQAIKEQASADSPWVTTDEILNATNFKNAMEAWRWRIEYNDKGEISDLQFEGEKLGDDVRLWDAIAPYVKAGSYIEMSGDEGCLWRWFFDGKKMIEQYARITWK